MKREYEELLSTLTEKNGGHHGKNKSVLVELLSGDDVAKIIRFETRDERDRKYDCFMKLVRRCGAQEIIDVIRRDSYILLVKALA